MSFWVALFVPPREVGFFRDLGDADAELIPASEGCDRIAQKEKPFGQLSCFSMNYSYKSLDRLLLERNTWFCDTR